MQVGHDIERGFPVKSRGDQQQETEGNDRETGGCIEEVLIGKDQEAKRGPYYCSMSWRITPGIRVAPSSWGLTAEPEVVGVLVEPPAAAPPSWFPPAGELPADTHKIVI